MLAGAGLAAVQLTGDDGQAGSTKQEAAKTSPGETGPATNARSVNISPSEVTVAVLNGTTIAGLAAQVGEEANADGFTLGTVTNAARTDQPRSQVLYRKGQKDAAGWWPIGSASAPWRRSTLSAPSWPARSTWSCWSAPTARLSSSVATGARAAWPPWRRRPRSERLHRHPPRLRAAGRGQRGGLLRDHQAEALDAGGAATEVEPLPVPERGRPSRQQRDLVPHQAGRRGDGHDRERGRRRGAGDGT